MIALAQCLAGYVEQHFRSALARDASGTVRPVLFGPPEPALRELFGILTNQGQGEWRLSINGVNRDIVVLLVNGKFPPPATGLSRGCHWDYAVTIRNSSPLVLILATPSSWDNRPESIANTTETLGKLSRAKDDDTLQPYLVNAIAARFALPPRQMRDLLRQVQKESSQLEPLARDAMPWEVIDALLSIAPGNAPLDSASLAAGVPVIGSGTQTLAESYGILKALAEFVGATGLRDAIDQMKATNVAQAQNVQNALDDLFSYLSSRIQSPTAFETAPSRYYVVPSPAPTWYTSLTAGLIEEILQELNQGQPRERLSLACTNGLPNVQPLRGGPFVVAASPELRATSAVAATPSFSRKVGTTQAALAANTGNPMLCLDANAPPHRKPIKYRADAPNHRPGTVDVLVLDTFEAGGLAVVRDAEHNGIPTLAARAGTWSQEITLTRGGTTEVLVFHSARTARLSVGRRGDPPTTVAVQPGRHHAAVHFDIEDNDAFDFTLFDAAGATIGTWQTQFTVRDTSDVSASRLHALIWQHRQGRSSVPRAADTALHRLELGAYLPEADSWKPVVGCWSLRIPIRIQVDWQGNRILGDVRPAIDPRPQVNPPQALLSAREAVRVALHQERRNLCEVELDKAPLPSLVEEYLRQYASWIGSDPQGASWLDVVAIYAAQRDRQAGSFVASQEPVAILLSPLHPLRLAWHVIAQGELATSLQDRCPAAGLISPAQCPDAGALYLYDGHTARPRAFFSLPCDHPHWAVLLNTTFLDRPERSIIMYRLAELGLNVQAITGGFTAQQTQDSLSEVNRLLPARATLRVGIVGEAESSSECGLGVFRWSEQQHAQDSTSPTGCFQVEVFDTRGASDPSPEQLADLSETTAERVRWFNLAADADVPKLDLTIIDQLGANSPNTDTGLTRSAISPGCLIRVRLREDFQNAQAIVESRVATTRLAGPSLPGMLASTVQQYEQLCDAGGSSHFRFTPNQQAVGNRLKQAIFLSVTSSQIDPACIVRGTVGQGGYLWDYELPGILGGGESNLGYYLVAQPTPAMYDAVARAATLVANPPPK